MESTIYYFSATGNSLMLARKIAGGLPDSRLVSMAAPPPHEPVGGASHIIGFVFPVFYAGLPRLVRRFAERLTIVKGTCCFAFTNYGGAAWDALGMLDDVLKEKGAPLSYADGANMPGNYIVKYSAFAPDTIQRLIEAAMEKAGKAARAIANGEKLPVQRTAKLFSKIANQNYLYRNIAEWDEKFRATGACTGCGICERVCPVSNIGLEDRRPIWRHRCERCLACLQWCPHQAIEYGKSTLGRERYRNPDAAAKDIMTFYEMPYPE
ncbi:MAG TPA: EFR1 family ferrodoxin [Feifaniaceae bacterium]|nr:EFR1 family ferrodoxin [Feifaniaceae bacterium]